MRVATAQLPDLDNSDDRTFTTDNAVIMLDGASAFVPVPVAAATALRAGKDEGDGGELAV